MSAKTDTLAAPAKSGYWYESARPLASLAFVAPLLLSYEIGVLLLGAQAIRNAADVWLRWVLDLLGFTQYFLLPIVTCGLLLAWHHVNRQPWRFQWTVLYGMLLESLAFGFVLVLIAGWQSRWWTGGQPACAADGLESGPSLAATVVAYLGAGTYEEVLFRLMLLPAAAWGCRLAGLSWRDSWGTGAVATSLLFAVAHYHWDFTLLSWHFATAHGEVFAWSSFVFRVLAGLTFSALFLFRGFGVTVGTHAAYDLFTLLV
ncbi:MAG: CPBP family intramembrane metalloprotease [Candidatus Anammoximicrobium sp.]|nr:CPBP family intramembrane metalloprotease [Candidatus Anammoximicrobium sp.]